MSEYTLTAKHDDGRELVFTDFVVDGATVDLFAEPEDEVGFQGTCVIYRDGGEWRARGLTDAERSARVDRLLRQARDTSLPRAERLRDPATDTGSSPPGGDTTGSEET